VERIKISAAAIAAAVTCLGSWAAAQEAPCSSRITRGTVVPCALKASLAVRAERDELDAARGRHVAVSPLLPSNPTLSLSGGRRSEPGRQATNWQASLAQELEIGGQRGLRRDSAQAEVDAQQKRVLVSQRDVAAAALAAFYEALAAREEQELASRLTVTAKAVSVVAHARADQGLIAPVDADVADATAVRIARSKLAADRQLGAAVATLATLLGRDPGAGHIDVEGELAPLSDMEGTARSAVALDSSARPEIRALEAERRAMDLRASVFRRSRVPNPTISAFVENDGFNERVLGLGLSFPIPIPGNVGRTYVGEVVEAEALARRAATERERALREIRLAMTTAAQAFASRQLEVEAFSPELLANAETSLRALGQEVGSGRLTVREAVVAQQALIELLQGYVAARRDWCLASVDLSRAAGVPLERGAP
jgi:cobalt-zinc-cadmium efflux system outer membrane protein